MLNRIAVLGRVAASIVLIGATLGAESDSSRWLDVEFPRDSPVLTVSFSLAPSTTRVRGASIALDLHASLVLRNTSNRPLSGLTLRVDAQDLPAGKGSLMVPSLDVQPGEVFPVRLDLQLTRPFGGGKTEGAMVQVSLDCAIFNDLSAYGPDRLKSRRSLTVYELEARRDRRYLAELLNASQYAQLREELNFGLQDVHPQQLGFEITRDMPRAGRKELAVSVDTMSFPGAPVQAIGGAAQISGNEVRTPRIEIRNTSRKAVRSVDMGWIIRDDRGRDFVAGSVPAALPLGPVQTAVANEPGTLRFSNSSGQPVAIGALMAFISNVEFADGNLWIPSRSDIEGATTDPLLRRALSSSPEQQRLAEVFRRKGIRGLAEELKRAN